MIETFLKHFNYLNRNNKRAGLLMFNNSKLTQGIEFHAKHLIFRLNYLKEYPSQESAAYDFQIFIDYVTHACREIAYQRNEHAAIHQRKNTYGNKISYCVPYTNGKFENEIVKGLKAVLRLQQTTIEEAIIIRNLISQIEKNDKAQAVVLTPQEVAYRRQNC